ncbi:unnamed protein product [Closterium sp. Naga37s-1]|nr:unnamed protein product [Closterium sp. Naga37s-1]
MSATRSTSSRRGWNRGSVLKPYVPPPGTHSPVRLPLSALPDVLLLVSSLLAMVIAGESWPLPKPAASASMASGKSPPVSASGSAAMKPPVPPAPKPAPSIAVLSASPTPDLVSGEAAQAVPDPPALPAPAVVPLAPVRPEPEQVAPAVVVVPPVAPVIAAPVIAAAPAALGGDLALAAVSATTGGPAPAVVPAEAVQSPPVAPPLVPSGQPCRPQSPDRRPSRPHSPSPRDERESSRRRQESPQRRSSGGNWHARRGGRGGWRGGYGRGRGGAFDGPVMMADLQRVVTAAMREEMALQANQQFPRATAAPPPVVPPVTAPAAVAPLCPAAPPAPYPSLLPCDSASRAAGAQSFQTFAGSSRAAEVPEATLGQLWRLSEGLRVVHLIQMYGHAGLSLGNTLVGGSRDECLEAADRLAELLAPVLAAPARGGVAGVGQLGTAVRGLRRFLRAGTAADVIGASTAVVRELHRSLTGLLAVLDADQF